MASEKKDATAACEQPERAPAKSGRAQKRREVPEIPKELAQDWMPTPSHFYRRVERIGDIKADLMGQLTALQRRRAEIVDHHDFGATEIEAIREQVEYCDEEIAQSQRERDLLLKHLAAQESALERTRSHRITIAALVVGGLGSLSPALVELVKALLGRH